MIGPVHFIDNKYLRWYTGICDRGRCRRDFVGGEKHHAMPRSLGGALRPVVALTFREHFLCHWLLTKFTSGLALKKMNHAFGMMTARGGHLTRNLSGWQYDRARRAISDAMRGNKHTLGRRHTAEAKAKVAAAKIGNTATLGYKHTVEGHRKMRRAQMGNKKWLGRKHTEETKEKMRRRAVGRFGKERSLPI